MTHGPNIRGPSAQIFDRYKEAISGIYITFRKIN